MYNANSGKFNAWLDSAHKILSPKTYPCRLCDLTYGIFKENEDWARFVDRFRESETKNKFILSSSKYESVVKTSPDLELEFLHIDEFEKKYWSKWLPKYKYPCILEKSEEPQDYNDGFGTNSGLDVFMGHEEMNRIESTQTLIDSITKKLKL